MAVMKSCLLILALSAFPLAAQTADQKIAALEARVAKLEELVAKLSGPQAPAADAGTGAATNKYGVPDKVLAKIKANAERIFDSSFDMQKTYIESEVKAYKELHGIK